MKTQEPRGPFGFYTRSLRTAAGALALVAFSIGWHSSLAAQLRPAPERQPNLQRELEMTIPGSFSVASIGDIIMMRPGASERDDPGIQAALGIVRDADVAVGNFEGSIADVPRFDGIIRYFLGPKEIAADLKAMGFDLLSRANNHTLDSEAQGMAETNDLLEAAGLTIAGTGRTLEEARSASYFETPKGRVGFVAIHAPHDPYSLLAATPQLGLAGGRAGVNALGYRASILVTREQLDALRSVRDALYAYRSEYTTPVPEPRAAEDRVELFGTTYVVGDRPGSYRYRMNQNDSREILRAIRNGKQYSDFMIVSIHAHQAPSPLQQSLFSDEPPDFLVDLAHAAIDNGADMFVGHGPHRVRGIEIYNGKQIFYGLGEFYAEMHWAIPEARDYLRRGANPLTTDLTDADLNTNLSPASWPSMNYESYVPVSRFQDGRLVEITLYPIELHYGDVLSKVGLPRLAPPDIATRILREAERLSKALGTEVVIEGDVGVIRMTPTTSAGGVR
jgi:poly-gamma-glutamate capsule biosynthesis protein CapA/YwtB (metallophosphatase superfamily)